LASRELVITRITWSREHDFTTSMERSISLLLTVYCFMLGKLKRLT